MVLKQLSLQNFRSYPKKEFDFSSGMTLVVGPNASGKTNLLEAIYLLALGKSFRAGVEREMISYGKEIGRLKGILISRQAEKNQLEIVLTTGEVGRERVPKKRYLINGVGKRKMDFVGSLGCVLFRPEDLEIVIDSPSIRRDYLDSVLEQTDREYRRASLSYQKGLRQRNKLLEQIREENRPRSILFFWDKLLIENGEIITQKRQELINFINGQPEHFGDLKLSYDKSLVSPQRLEKYAREEVAAAMTLVGPHRDDIVFSMKEPGNGKARNLHIYGSRGEQRLAVLSLKLAELEFVAEKTGRRPLLLLDDIFSELDQEHRARVFKVIPKQQTIITTTDLGLVKKEYQERAKILKLI